MEEEIKRIEHLIERCKQCKLNACINCEISYTEVQEIKKLVKRVIELEKDIEKEKIYYEHARDLIEKYQDLVRMILNDRDKNFVPKAEIEKKDKIMRAIIKAYKQDMGSNTSIESTIQYFTNKVEREGK